MSVPNQNSADGCRRRSTGATACGSTVPSQGASTAIRTMVSSTIPPAIAVGWRRNASLKRARVGDCECGPAMALVAMSVADARIEEHIGEIDREVDQHVDAGKDQDHPLDD